MNVRKNNRIFIGSSSEAVCIAEAVFACLKKDKVSPKLWNQHLFGLSQNILESLEQQLREFDFAVLVASADDKLMKRGQVTPAIRDNIVFELGLFIGALGRKRTFLICPINPNIQQITDLSGIVYATYDAREISTDLSENVSAVKTACLEIEQAISRELLRVEQEIRVAEPQEYEEAFSNKLIELFTTMEVHDDHDMISDFGHTVALALWKRGFYKTRERLGHIILAAAIIEKNTDLQIEALIDYIGWMKASCGDLTQGEKHIREGLYLADRNGNHYWSAKGYRHLAAIHYKRDELDDARFNLQESIRKADNIGEPEQKFEQLGAIHYGLTEIAIKAGRLDDAVHHNDVARSFYERLPDKSRAIKLIPQMGQIEEKRDNNIRALNYYYEGLQEAKAYKRRDDEIRILYGLIRVLEKEGSFQRAQRYRDLASQLEKTTSILIK